MICAAFRNGGEAGGILLTEPLLVRLDQCFSASTAIFCHSLAPDCCSPRLSRSTSGKPRAISTKREPPVGPVPLRTSNVRRAAEPSDCGQSARCEERPEAAGRRVCGRPARQRAHCEHRHPLVWYPLDPG